MVRDGFVSYVQANRNVFCLLLKTKQMMLIRSDWCFIWSATIQLVMGRTLCSDGRWLKKKKKVTRNVFCLLSKTKQMLLMRKE